MKKMTCQQLGGACDFEFTANSFQEMAEMSKKHAMQMFQKGDEAHIAAMNKMKEQMQNQKPEEMKAWFDGLQAEFDALPSI